MTGALCVLTLAAATFVTAAAAINHYGWVLGAIIGWTLGPVVGGAACLVVFLWLLPLQSPPTPVDGDPAKVAGWRRVRRPKPATNGQKVSISVVMPVYNGRHFLERSLPALAAMRAKGDILELIVVDDGSTDDSAAFAASHGATVLPSGGRRGPGAARNLAAEQAKGDVLWFVDADVVAYPAGPDQIREAFREENVVAVFGSYDDRPPESNFGSQYKNLLHHHHHQKPNDAASTFWSGCGAVSRAAFLTVGGFDPAKYKTPSIEDVELGYRLRAGGGRIKRDPRLLSSHLKRWSIPELVRTDIFKRAVPWSRLMLEREQILDELNISESERLRAALAAVIVMVSAASVAALAPVWAVPLLCLTAVTTNWPLFRLFYRAKGLPFALLAITFHQVYYIYSSCTFLLCWAEAKLKNLRRKPAEAAEEPFPPPPGNNLDPAGGGSRG